MSYSRMNMEGRWFLKRGGVKVVLSVSNLDARDGQHPRYACSRRAGIGFGGKFEGRWCAGRVGEKGMGEFWVGMYEFAWIVEMGGRRAKGGAGGGEREGYRNEEEREETDQRAGGQEGGLHD